MHVVLIHWRIKTDEKSIKAFLKDWREKVGTLSARLSV